MKPLDRLFVLDPLPLGKGGHHQHFIDGTLRDAGTWCTAVHFLVARPKTNGPPAEPPFHEVFRHYLYKQLSLDPDTGPRVDFETGSDAFCRDLAALTALAPTARDLILLPSATLRILGGVAKWRLAVASPTPVAALFHHAVPFHLELEPGTLGATLAGTAAALLTAPGATGPVLIGSTNEALAAPLRAAMKREVRVLPLPHWYDLDGESDEPGVASGDSALPAVGFIGALRKEKGGDRLPAILSSADALPVRWVAQTTAPDPGLLAPMQALGRAGRMTLIESALTDRQFVRLIRDLSLILLPYERARYAARVSGPFAFAAAFGRPCIVPDGTWMAAQIDSGNAAGIVYRGDAPAAVAAAIGAAVERLPELREQAASRAERWRRTENGTALLKTLIKWTTSEQHKIRE